MELRRKLDLKSKAEFKKSFGNLHIGARNNTKLRLVTFFSLIWSFFGINEYER